MKCENNGINFYVWMAIPICMLVYWQRIDRKIETFCYAWSVLFIYLSVLNLFYICIVLTTPIIYWLVIVVVYFYEVGG